MSGEMGIRCSEHEPRRVVALLRRIVRIGIPGLPDHIVFPGKLARIQEARHGVAVEAKTAQWIVHKPVGLLGALVRQERVHFIQGRKTSESRNPS